MNYRDKSYASYVSTHTSNVSGLSTIAKVKEQFIVWKRYYSRALPKNKNAKILDAGCGNGSFVYFLQTLGFKNSRGIDISGEQIETACRLGIPGITLGDFRDFLLKKSDAYDVIFMRDCIEHFTKDEILSIMETVHHALNDNGILVIQVPNGEALFAARLRYADFTHETMFTRNSLSQLFGLSGFRRFEFYPVGPVPKGLLSLCRYILWNGITLAFRFYMAVETGNPAGIFTRNIIAIAKK